MENRERYNRRERAIARAHFHVSRSFSHSLSAANSASVRPGRLLSIFFFASPRLSPFQPLSLPRFAAVPLRTAYKIRTTSPRLRHRLARQIGFPKKWPRGLFSPVPLSLPLSPPSSLSAHFPLRISKCINTALKSTGHARPTRPTMVGEFRSDPRRCQSSLFNYRWNARTCGENLR